MTSILVVSEIFYPEGGGAEKATYLILRHLVQHNFKITVITGTKNPAKMPGVEYYVTSYLLHSNRLTKLTHLKLLANNPFFMKLLQEHDILYIPLYACSPLISLAKKKGLRVVVHLHNYMPVRYSSIKYFFEPDAIGTLDEFKLAVFHEYYTQKSLLRTLSMPLSFSAYLLSKRQIVEVDKLICVSLRQAEIIARSNPRLTNKIEVIYNPLPPELISDEPRKEPADIPTFLYVGGDSFVKGFPLLLYAINYIGKQDVKARFILAGSYRARSLNILRRLKKIHKRLDIQVIGKVSFSDLAKAYKVAWVLVFPSIVEEPLPYAVFESSLLATIPIAPNLGGVKEVLGGTTGEKYMFDSRDLKSMLGILDTIASRDPHDIIEDGMKLRSSALSRFKNAESLNKLLRVLS
jgi:glycosyltransferase involved in cell wall biosynthesis